MKRSLKMFKAYAILELRFLSGCSKACFISYIHERATHFQKLESPGLTFD